MTRPSARAFCGENITLDQTIAPATATVAVKLEFAAIDGISATTDVFMILLSTFPLVPSLIVQRTSSFAEGAPVVPIPTFPFHAIRMSSFEVVELEAA